MEPNVDPIAEERARLASALANLEAAKARVERDAALVHAETRQQLVAELLPVLDNFDRAIAAAAARGDAPSLVEGVQMIHRQLENVLVGYGLVRFDATEAAFDPAIHDATAIVPVGEPERDGIVVEQLQAGYRFEERLLRAAKVVVGKRAA